MAVSVVLIMSRLPEMLEKVTRYFFAYGYPGLNDIGAILSTGVYHIYFMGIMRK